MGIKERIENMVASGDYIENGSVERLRQSFDKPEFESTARLAYGIRSILNEQPGRGVKLPALSATEASILADFIAYASARIISEAASGLAALMGEGDYAEGNPNDV